MYFSRYFTDSSTLIKPAKCSTASNFLFFIICVTFSTSAKSKISKSASLGISCLLPVIKLSYIVILCPFSINRLETSLRIGEKLYEELLIGDNVSETKNPLIMRAKENKIHWEQLKLLLENPKKENESNNHEKIRNLLIKIVPGFKPQSEISDIMYKN